MLTLSWTEESDCARRVLVVEDDVLVQARLRPLIEGAGFTVTIVPSIVDARTAVAAAFYPTVIIDRTLVDGDGITLCADLRGRNNGRVFVLVLSGLDSQHNIAEGLRAGADVYLSKRVSDAEVLAYLEAAAAVAQFAARFEGKSSL